MVTFVKLAAICQDRRQTLQRDRFLLLSGAAACEAGLNDVAEQCRTLVVAGSPQHLAARFPSLADALCDADYLVFHTQLLRFCSYEQAEHLLAQQGLATGRPSIDAVSPRDYALLMLRRMSEAVPSRGDLTGDPPA